MCGAMRRLPCGCEPGATRCPGTEETEEGTAEVETRETTFHVESSGAVRVREEPAAAAAKALANEVVNKALQRAVDDWVVNEEIDAVARSRILAGTAS